MFELTINTDNEAFEDAAGTSEVARILRKIADKLDNMADAGRCIDYNGNIVGTWELVTEEVDEDDGN